MKVVAIILVLTTAAFAQVVILGVNVVDLEKGVVRPNQTVKIDRGVLKTAHSPENPKDLFSKGATVVNIGGVRHVDGRGKYLIPGLWDMHVHVAGITAKPAWAGDLMRVYFANGITAVRDMGGDLAALKQLRMEANSKFPPRELQDQLPRMWTPGPFLDAEANGYGSPTEVVAVKTPEEARAAVQRLSKDGADFIKTGSRLSPEVFRAIADECKKQGLAFLGHVPDAVSVEEASDLGMKSMEHLFGFQLALTGREVEFRKRAAELRARNDREGLSKLNEDIEQSFDPKAANALFAKLKKNGTWIVPTLIWTKTATTLMEVKQNEPRLRYVPKALRDEWTPEKAAKIFSPRGIAFYKKKLANDMKLVKLLSDAGVKLLAGSDSLDPYVFPGDSLNGELELMVEAGLTPLAALRTATTLPREFVKEPATSGWVVLDANPLENISNTRKVFMVIREVPMKRDELDSQLNQVEVKFKQ